MAKRSDSLSSRTLRIAAFRIGTVSLCVGIISYFFNQASLESSIKEQILLSTEQTLQRESAQFTEIRDLEANFVREFKRLHADPALQPSLVRDFDAIFYRHEDGSFTQRPGLFEGAPLPDGRRYRGMSATYAPDIPPDDDVKARFALSYRLSYKYGSSTQGRTFNFYGVVPEKGFPIFQDADIAKVFVYSGPDALKLETYEFFDRGFGGATSPFLTRMYFDQSNNAWMTTMATPDPDTSSGKPVILACVDILLDDLMRRIGRPAIQGAYSSLFLTDDQGTLIYHPEHLDDIKQSDGAASIASLDITKEQPVLALARTLPPGQVKLTETADDIVAVGLLAGTPWALAIHYPKALMRPSVLQNLGFVIALGLITLVVEIFIIRNVLVSHVALPLGRLIRATRLIGAARDGGDARDLPVEEHGEVGELAREFRDMALRVGEAHRRLEDTVRERTVALEEANRKLLAITMTDPLTGVANRRGVDAVMGSEWGRACRSRSLLMVAMIDVDWFKAYNDHYGHPAGDECLRTIARTVTEQLHRPGDFVGRYGGEEFIVIGEVSDIEGAETLTRRIHDALAVVAIPHAVSPIGRVTLSIGCACAVPTTDGRPECLLAAADEALYRAKRQGRDQTVLVPDALSAVAAEPQPS